MRIEADIAFQRGGDGGRVDNRKVEQAAAEGAGLFARGEAPWHRDQPVLVADVVRATLVSVRVLEAWRQWLPEAA